MAGCNVIAAAGARLKTWRALAALSVLALVGAVVVSRAPATRGVEPLVMTGTIAAVDPSASSLTLETAASSEVLSLGRASRIVRGNRRLSTGTLVGSVGERAKVTYQTIDGTPTVDEIRLAVASEMVLPANRSSSTELHPAQLEEPDQTSEPRSALVP